MALNPKMSDKYGVEDTLDERQWAKLAPMLGQPYYVNGAPDLACTAATTSFATNIAAGRAACFGFGADFQAQTVTHPATTGVRYDLVAMRYDWTPDEAGGGGNAYPVVITGGSVWGVMPSARQKTPGVTYDMPLAIAKVDVDPVTKTSKIISYDDLRRFPTPIFSKSVLTVPPEDRIDGLQVTYGGVTSYWRKDRNAWVSPQAEIRRDSITPYTAAQTIKNPRSGWLLSQLTIKDPGSLYSVIVTGQLEIGSANRVEVWMQWATSASSTSWTMLSPQFLQNPLTTTTTSLSTQFIPNRTGQTVVNLLARISTSDPAKTPAFSTTQYNGFLQGMVIPL